MAGIVAQITKANWERIQKRRWFLSADKSNYYLPPFEQSFNPIAHVPYYRRRKLLQQRANDQLLRQQLWEALEKMTEESKQSQKSLSKALTRLQNASAAICLLLPIAIVLFLLANFWHLPQMQDCSGHQWPH